MFLEMKGKKTGGRQKGSLNKITQEMQTVREVVLAAFHTMQEDPENNIIEWGKRETTEFYRIASKLLPNEVVAEVKQVINIKIGD